MYPDRGEKQPGDFVESVHPCATYSDGGVVIWFEDDVAGGSVYVRTGRGSTCYGPAANWRVVDRAPVWLLEELRRLGCTCPGDCGCRFQGEPWRRRNVCGCRGHELEAEVV